MPSSALSSDIVDTLRNGPASASALTRALEISQPTVSRALRALIADQHVLQLGGRTRGARYALRRMVDEIGSAWPLYRIDEQGVPHEIGPLYAIERESYVSMTSLNRLGSTFEGLPYYLQDARPGGFLGRAIPAAYPELGLPSRVVDWTDDHVLIYLTRRGMDSVGDLVLGSEALDLFLARAHTPTTVALPERGVHYGPLAEAAMAGAPPGSSAQGEHPKFTVCLAEGDRRTHMIVKFSPPRASAAGQRWADLLISEHVAHRVLEANSIRACRSNIIESGERLFLECERFDRIGVAGRRGAVSLFALDTTRYGKLDNWSASAARLAMDGLLSADDAERIRLLDAFGALTANTDRHFGNVTLFDRYAGHLELAPVYDMLPMLFAPQSDQLVQRTFAPTPPTAAWLSVWARAMALAETYWDALVNDLRLSADFRTLCAQSRQALGPLLRQDPPRRRG
jgi:DNA-binding transcriptional ArsR family regulator